MRSAFYAFLQERCTKSRRQPNGNTITAAVGAEVRACSNFAVRAAYETAITDDDDLFVRRWTFSAVLKF